MTMDKIYRIKVSGDGVAFPLSDTPEHPIDCRSLDEAIEVVVKYVRTKRTYYASDDIIIHRENDGKLAVSGFVDPALDIDNNNIKYITDVYDYTKYHAKYGGKLFYYGE
jgi:hypothetical protein